MPTQVTLHIYDVSTSSEVKQINQYLTAVGTGAFHGALEVYGKEWSYGYAEKGTGVFSCPPKGCTAHTYRESHKIAEINLSETEVNAIIEKFQTEWPGTDYDLLRHNCVIFSNELSKALGAGPIPSWVTSLAGAGATVCDGAIKAVSQVQAAAIIAKAKAGEIDEKYNVKGTAQVKASEFIASMNGLDKQYNIRENAAKAATQGGALASQAATKGGALASEAYTKAQDLDQQYRLREQAGEAASKAAVQGSALASQAGAQGSALASQAGAKAQQLDEQYKLREKAQEAASQAYTKSSALASQAGELARGLVQRTEPESGTVHGTKGTIIEGEMPKTPAPFCGFC